MPSMHSVTRRWLVGVVCAISVQASWAATAVVDFSELVEQNAKTVVNISATAKSNSGKNRLPQQQVPDIFKKFFGDEFGMPQQRDRQSFGSGFIISKDGYVLTNNHVVADSDKVVIRLNDRRELEAEVIGTDERTDVALLKIKADDLPWVKIGNCRFIKRLLWLGEAKK